MATPKKTSAYATVNDLNQLRKDMQKDMQEQLQYMLKTIMTAMQDMERRMATKEDLEASEHRMLVAMETMREDLVDTNNDKLEQHDDRITALEVHAGWKPA